MTEPRQSTSQDKLDKVRKLLALAERAATEAEAEAFTEKALALMATHGIDQALLEDQGDPEEIIALTVKVDRPYPKEKACLFTWIGEAMRCRGVHHTRSKVVHSATLVGFRSDVERAELLYTSLLLQATSQVVHQRPEWWMNESVAAFRRTWLVGFSNTVWQRVEDAEARAKKDAEFQRVETAASTSVELVLVSRSERVQRRVEELYPTLTKGRARTLRGSGWEAGRTAGERADIGGKRVGGQRPALR